jgi:hypothetical protein
MQIAKMIGGIAAVFFPIHAAGLLHSENEAKETKGIFQNIFPVCKDEVFYNIQENRRH